MVRWKFKAIDSLYKIQLDHKVMAVTYSPEWQGIRLSVSFKSYEATRRTIGIGNAYIGAATTDNEHKCRLIRVRNLLTAIRVYNVGIDVLTAEIIQDHIEIFGKVMEEKTPELIWDWHDARKQAYTMHKRVINLFDMMRRNLLQRATRGKKTELRYFLSILDEVIDESTA